MKTVERPCQYHPFDNLTQEEQVVMVIRKMNLYDSSCRKRAASINTMFPRSRNVVKKITFDRLHRSEFFVNLSVRELEGILKRCIEQGLVRCIRTGKKESVYYLPPVAISSGLKADS